jgi:hypothetical protein
MKRLVPAILLVALLSGFRAFPSLSEPDPRVVFTQFQNALNRADTMDDLYRYLSARKKREYQRKSGAASVSPGGEDRLLEGVRSNFYLMKAELVAEDIQKDTAILVYKGAVNLNGVDYVYVTMGVLLIKEDGSWKVDRDKITYKHEVEHDGATHEETGRMVF